jgi:hypothetical protein
MTIFNKESIERVNQRIEARNIGIITAHPNLGTAPTKQDEHSRKIYDELKNEIHKSGFGFIHVRGCYLESHSQDIAHYFLIYGKKGDDKGKLFNFLKNNSEKYHLGSFLHKASQNIVAVIYGNKEEILAGSWDLERIGAFFNALEGTFAPENWKSIRFFNEGIGRGFFRRDRMYDEEVEI